MPPTPSRATVRRILLALGGGAALGAALLAALLTAIDRGHLHGPLLRWVSTGARHSVRAERLAIRLFDGPPRVVAERVVIGSPEWLPGEDVAEIGKLTLTFRPTLRHPLRIRTLGLERAILRPHRDARDRANWRTNEAADAPGSGLLPIEALELKDVAVMLRDERRHLDFDGTVATRARGRGEALTLEARGKLNGHAFEASLQGEPLLHSRADRPWHFDFDARSTGTRLTGKGVVLRPFDFSAMDIRFDARGADLRDLYYLVGVKLPDTGPYTGSGTLARREHRLAFEDLRGQSGESDLGGKVLFESRDGRSTFTADLHSRRARVRDMGPRAAGREPHRDGPRLLFPEARIPLQGLRDRDGELRYRADTLLIGPMTLHDVATRVRIKGGMVKADPLTVGDALKGTLSFDARTDAPEGRMALRFEGLEIGDLFRGAQAEPAMTGPLRGTVELRGTGDSLHALAGSADGTVDATLDHGAIRESLAEILGVDFRGIGLAMSRSQQTLALHCARARFIAREGRLEAQQLVADTDASVVEGSGSIDLAREALDLELDGRPKSMRLRLRTSLLIGGSLVDPAPRIEKRRTALQGGAALALGTLVAPVAAGVAFIDPGRARDVDCTRSPSRE